jgi:hypothetical protein
VGISNETPKALKKWAFGVLFCVWRTQTALFLKSRFEPFSPFGRGLARFTLLKGEENFM